MKRFMTIAVVLGSLLIGGASVTKADHRNSRVGFSISFGNGYNSFSGAYGQGYGRPYGGGYGGGYGGHHVHRSYPVYNAYPTFAVPVYPSHFGGGYGVGYGGGYGGHGYHGRHCR